MTRARPSSRDNTYSASLAVAAPSTTRGPAGITSAAWLIDPPLMSNLITLKRGASFAVTAYSVLPCSVASVILSSGRMTSFHGIVAGFASALLGAVYTVTNRSTPLITTPPRYGESGETDSAANDVGGTFTFGFTPTPNTATSAAAGWPTTCRYERMFMYFANGDAPGATSWRRM